MHYSKRLGFIENDQLQAALDRYDLGLLQHVEFIHHGHFGQNLYLQTSTGRYVFRGNPIREEQFPKEQFFARLIDETTSFESPQPYFYDSASDIFGWEYAIMRRLEGHASDNPSAAAAVVTPTDHAEVAFELGHAVFRLQSGTFTEPALYNLPSRTLQAIPGGYIAWAQSLIRNTLAAAAGLTEDDRSFISATITNMPGAIGTEFRPTLCHADFHYSNVLVRQIDGAWKVAGIIDLTSCHIGHPLSDLARQFCLFAEIDPVMARTFIHGYSIRTPMPGNWQEQLSIFILHDRLKFWEWAKRKDMTWWDARLTFRHWLETFSREIG